MRAESVQGQLDGSIPATTEGQKEDPEALIQQEVLRIATMVRMNGGKEGEVGGMGKPEGQGFDPAVQAGNVAPPDRGGANMGQGDQQQPSAQSGGIKSYTWAWTGDCLGLLEGPAYLSCGGNELTKCERRPRIAKQTERWYD